MRKLMVAVLVGALVVVLAVPAFATTKWWSSGGNGGFWFVRTNGSLNSPGTFAGCDNFS